MKMINVILAVAAIASAALSLLSSQVKFPAPRGTLSDIDPAIAHQTVEAQRRQALLIRWAAIAALVSALLAIAMIR
jgi:hypothetical protein